MMYVRVYTAGRAEEQKQAKELKRVNHEATWAYIPISYRILGYSKTISGQWFSPCVPHRGAKPLTTYT